MHKVELRIQHKTCWGSEISTKFPNHEFSSVDCRWIKNRVVHIIHVRGEAQGFGNVTTYLKKRQDVVRVELLSEDDHNLYLRVLTKKDQMHPQFSDLFFTHDCFPVAPTRFEGKYEIWTLGTASRENINDIYTLLKKKHFVKINWLKEENMHHSLTHKQREVLNYAKIFGYFEWPRRKNVTEICKLVGIKKTVFLSHLRKAENKIMNEFLTKEE